MDDGLIYLDNAATTFPKPGRVLAEMVETYGRMGVSPGRGSYDAALVSMAVIPLALAAAGFFAVKPTKEERW